MSKWRPMVFGCAMLTVGYLLGTVAGTTELSVFAQKATDGPSADSENKIRAANRSLIEAMESLRTEGRYESITNGPNAFLILSGGGDAKDDLESGRGVDPETFAALYSGQVIPEIQDQLDRDELNRVTYNNEVVRMYSRSRL
ncbi:MAG: hypothetical protein KDA69_00475 [Planctomycetaceae bacterium]|nr:hypothetical protein [Planctomycetaceae bacterium]